MHYMNASTYDLDNFIFNNEQGIYVFKTGTELINGPNSSITGPCTLQMLFNSADPVDRNIYAQQILYYSNSIFRRTCYWEQTSPGVHRTEWGDWHSSVDADWFNNHFKFGTRVTTVNNNNGCIIFTANDLKQLFGTTEKLNNSNTVCFATNGDLIAQGHYMSACGWRADSAGNTGGGYWIVQEVNNSSFIGGNIRINYLVIRF